MDTLYQALIARRSAICGYQADLADIKHLASYLVGTPFASLLRIYDDLPVCGMIVRFQMRHGKACAPASDFANQYDPDRDHEFYWPSPTHIVERLADEARGTLAFQAGYAPIGECAFGGDTYFLSKGSLAPGAMHLYRVYYDWIAYPEVNDPPVPPEAIALVCDSLESVVAVATFLPGLKPLP